MNMKEIKEILQMMKDHDLSEVEIEKDGLKIKLKKTGAGISFEKSAGGPGTQVSYPKQNEAGSGAGSQEAAAAQTESQGITIVRSPMVGTFYSAPSPDQPPFLTVGQAIRKGSVLCIVEAMKLMNEIKSEVDGKVVEFLVTNGQTVEFDQPLFKIKVA